ncbi:MAG: hypothetical protein Q8L49_09075, partial [Burkholderiaceae bacterium]|nr:hypothetical protein [Burkholderiaceae bacterium]
MARQTFADGVSLDCDDALFRASTDSVSAGGHRAPAGAGQPNKARRGARPGLLDDESPVPLSDLGVGPGGSPTAPGPGAAPDTGAARRLADRLV